MCTYTCVQDECIATSAKTGQGVDRILPAIVDRLRPPALPQGGGGGGAAAEGKDRPLRARVVDSWFDTHRGVICLVQVP